jgi:hypothetical protein
MVRIKNDLKFLWGKDAKNDASPLFLRGNFLQVIAGTSFSLNFENF